MKLGKWCVAGMRLLLWSAIAFAQDPEAARLERNGDQAILTADHGRPVDSAAKTLAEAFGIRVNVEDPPYVFSGDIIELTVGVPQPVRVPKGGRLEVRFALGPDGRPADVPGLVKAIADVANAQFPFGYRIDADGDWFTLVPTRTRDVLGQTIPIIPLLDRHVTISPGTRPISASAALMTDALSAQTGLQVSCCQGAVAGIPWGLQNIPFEASDEPARNVLKRLIVAASGGRPSWEYWLERCSPLPSTFCFINLLPAALR